MKDLSAQIIEHIRYLSQEIGGRGSCTVEERLAGEYIAGQMQALRLQDIRSEPFRAIPSTYWPYGLAFALALTGSLVSLLFDGRGTQFLGMLFNTLGFWAMLAETEFKSSWTHWALPRAQSQNFVGSIPPSGAVSARVVLCAHLDTHRTPIFYASKAWNSVFSILLALTFLSMFLGALGFGLALFFGWEWMRWLGLIIVPVQAFALAMCLHADFTSFSPGANDNASGAGVILALSGQLARHPLRRTEVHLLFTGCEEVGDQGMAAFLDSHSERLGSDTVYIILDQVGSGRIKYLTADGLIFKHKTHPRALQLARQAAERKPELGAFEGVGLAYTDALRATRRGLCALTLCAIPADSAGGAHWHQMSDTLEHIVPEDLFKTHQFTWELLQLIDGSSGQ
jgi:hypothetical protein